jgi:DNA-binding response OmpR family regulator
VVGKSGQVLIVEDEAIIAWDLTDSVETLGLTVVGPAHTLQQGFDFADRHELSAALLDINLGSETVWPLATKLCGNGVPIVFISASLDTTRIAVDFPTAKSLSKPIGRTEIARCFAELDLAAGS